MNFLLLQLVKVSLKILLQKYVYVVYLSSRPYVFHTYNTEEKKSIIQSY